MIHASNKDSVSHCADIPAHSEWQRYLDRQQCIWDRAPWLWEIYAIRLPLASYLRRGIPTIDELIATGKMYGLDTRKVVLIPSKMCQDD